MAAQLVDVPLDVVAHITTHCVGTEVVVLWKCGSARLNAKLAHGAARVVLRNRRIANAIVRIPAVVLRLHALHTLIIEVHHAAVLTLPPLTQLPATLRRLNLTLPDVALVARTVPDNLRAVEHLTICDPLECIDFQKYVAVPEKAISPLLLPTLPRTLHTLKLSGLDTRRETLTALAAHIGIVDIFSSAVFEAVMPPALKVLRLSAMDLRMIIGTSNPLNAHVMDAFGKALAQTSLTRLYRKCTSPQQENFYKFPFSLQAANVADLPHSLRALSVLLHTVPAQFSFPLRYLTSLHVGLGPNEYDVEAAPAVWRAVPPTVTDLAVATDGNHLFTAAEFRALLPARLTSLAVSVLPFLLEEIDRDDFWPPALCKLVLHRWEEAVAVPQLRLPPATTYLWIESTHVRGDWRDARQCMQSLRTLCLHDRHPDYALLPQLTDLTMSFCDGDHSCNLTLPPTLLRFACRWRSVAYPFGSLDGALPMAQIVAALPPTLLTLDVGTMCANSPAQSLEWFAALPPSLTTLHVYLLDEAGASSPFPQLLHRLPRRLKQLSLAYTVAVMPARPTLCGFLFSALPARLESLHVAGFYFAPDAPDATLWRLRHLSVESLRCLPTARFATVFPRLETLHEYEPLR